MMSPVEDDTDKKQIEAEEQQVMLPAETPAAEAGPENGAGGPVKTALAGAVSEEGREVKPKFIPIGGIKMPGFFTRNSDKNKQEEEGGDVEAEKEEEKTKHKRRRLLFTCPFTRVLHHAQPTEDPPAEVAATNERVPVTQRVRDALRGPADRLAAAVRRARRRDPEAALASAETLGDKDKEDGMENIKLDTPDEPEGGQVATKLPLRERIRQRKFIKDDILVPLAGLVLVALAIVVAVAASARPPAERPLRDGRFVTTLTGCGPVEGILKDSVYQFYGIPYAVPPVGERRFTYSRPLNNISSCWTGTRAALEPAPPCLQTLANRTVVGAEDCLTLDVTTPHVRYDSPLPVVVLVGAASLEGGASPLQPSAFYSRARDVVFVRPNFRLGPLGFLALQVLSDTKYPPTSGNYGLSDLVVALQWVNLNIKHFGGDPSSVVILGHRAGATLASLVTAMPSARRLYARAWLSSSSVIFPGDSLQESQEKNKIFLANSGCETVECLRALNATQLLGAVPDTWAAGYASGLPAPGEAAHSWLVRDGELVRQHPYDAWAAERKEARWEAEQADRVVFGTSEHAAHTDFLQRRHANWTAREVGAMVSESALGNSSALLAAWFNATYDGLAGLVSAVRYVCPLVSAARLRLDAPLVVAGGAAAARAADADVAAILGTLSANTTQARRFMTAAQHLFYYWAGTGRLPAGTPRLVQLAQDPLPLALPACDELIRADLVPRYAHVD